MKEEFRFEDFPTTQSGHFKKMLYIGSKLYGIGSGQTARKAKIECARDGVNNLREGKQAKREFSKAGLMEYLKN